MKQAFNKRARTRRGMTLLEVLIAGALSTAIMGTTIGVYVHSVRGFYGNQAQAYTQFRTRTALDSIAKEIRSSKALIPAYDVYTTHNGNGIVGTETNGACIILQAPAQDSANMSLFHYGSSSDTPNALVTDIIIYRHKPSAKTLECTIIPARDVVASDGNTHNSYRAELTDAVVATNVNTLRFVFRDRDGSSVASGFETRTAAVDIVTNIQQARSGDTIQTYGISGVRLRNMRSGSIPGVVNNGGAPVKNALLIAIYTSAGGAYTQNTIVGRATSDVDGQFEIFGLEAGAYTVKAYASDNGVVKDTITHIDVPEEEASNPIAVNLS